MLKPYVADGIATSHKTECSDLEEAMIESGKSLSYSKNYYSVLEKIVRLHIFL